VSAGLLIDLDGTLADSLGVMRTLYFRFLTGLNRSGSDAEFESLNGPPLDEVVERLRTSHGLQGSLPELRRSYLAAVEEAYREVGVMEGGRQLLDRARAAGWPIGVVTSNHETVARTWLERQRLEVDAVVSAADVENGKPDPEPFVVGLRRLGVAPEVSVAVEDSRAGAEAALAAGLATYVIGSRAAPWPPGAHWCSDLHQVAREVFGV